MRSRPDIDYELSPEELTPGVAQEITIVLTSDADTPYDGIHVVLRGRERRARDRAAPQEALTRAVRREAKLEAGVLTPGVNRFPLTFDLPPELAPSYLSDLSENVYELDVHVDIPWWPDARAVFTVRASPPPATTSAAPPVLVSTEPEPTGTDLYVEAALASSTLVVGERVVGALSLANVAHHRVSAIELVMHSIETAVIPSTAGPFVAERWVHLVREGKPAEGETIPFGLTVPDHLTPTFVSRLIRLTHELRVRVAVTLGDDVVLAIPVQVLPRGALPTRASDDALPDVGRTAYTPRWQAAAARLLERRRVRSSVRGSTLVMALADGRAARLRVELVQARPSLVAELAWPALGIDLRVEDRGIFGGTSGIEGLPRFTFRAREPHQLGPVFDGPTIVALARFRGAAMSDTAGRFFVDAPGGAAVSDASIDAFIEDALALDAQMATASSRVPLPSALEPLGPRFAALASAWGATLRPGDLSITGFAVRGVETCVRHTFVGPTPTECVVEALPIPGTELPFDIGTRLQAELGLRAESRDAVFVHLDVATSPDHLERVVAVVSAALRRLAPETFAGPYR